MYLHLGGDVSVNIKNMVAIMDLETTSVSKITKEFLSFVQKNNSVINVNDDLPKSYVITFDEKETKVYVSPISSQTLLKRANNIREYYQMPQFK